MADGQVLAGLGDLPAGRLGDRLVRHQSDLVGRRAGRLGDWDDVLSLIGRELPMRTRWPSGDLGLLALSMSRSKSPRAWIGGRKMRYLKSISSG